MANEKFAKYFLEDVNRNMDKGDFLEAGDTFAARFSGHGPAWTWEVDTLYRQPIGSEETNLRSQICEAMLRLANGLFVFLKGNRLANVDLAFNRLSQLVLCLNRLGEMAPKELVNKTFDLIDNWAQSVYRDKAEYLYSLTPFLPGVSYFH